MRTLFQYGNEELTLDLPEDSILYESGYKSNSKSSPDLLMESLASPVSGRNFEELVQSRRQGNTVIVVSDITRPIPYQDFLPQMLFALEKSGVTREEICILVATGMHRASTREEHLKMFGAFVADNYRIVDHDCMNDEELKLLEERSWSGSKVRLNRWYAEAGFRIVTGLVEPHFMAGFSGGRKAICPGLVGLDTIQKFHGYAFLSHPNATSSMMTDNPCNLESTSVARLCPPDFSINIVLDNRKKINAIISGELFSSHLKAVNYVKAACCPPVTVQADVAVTSSGGYPLDATFYQCVKGLVNCLPAIREEGEIIAFGGCAEGVGSSEYKAILERYSGNFHQFIEDIRADRFFIKDQWQLQMHIRVLKKIGQKNLHFYTSNIPAANMEFLHVNPHPVFARDMQNAVQEQVNEAVALHKRIAVFPEGPYCSPVA